MDNQTTIFEMLYPTYKFTKPIRTIELFGGYGSQLLALKYLGADVEQWKLCEWAVKSIQAYKDLHFTDDDTDYSKDLTIEQVKEYLYKKGISSNYNDPMTEKQVQRLGDKQARTIYNNIIATHNLVNIQQVKGEDLEISDTDKYTYILTYSFPCQDLSLAGKGAGMSDTTTRSGLLWEVERLLTECKELGSLPEVLLMENVPMVHSSDNVQFFNKFQLRLEELGYKNYWQDLIATDYGIPQTRNRTFMISILGDYNYTFPKPIPLKLKLKDMLEDNVDEKYYLSDKMMEYITSKDDKYKVNENNLTINRDIACSKTTREGNTRADTTDYICDELPDNFNIKNGCRQIYDLNYYNHEQSNRVYSPEYSSPTLRTKCDEAGTIKIEDNRKVIRKYGLFDKKDKIHQAGSIYDKEGLSPTLDTATGGYSQPMIEEKILIKNANLKGYLEATEGDGIDISSRMEYHRGTVQKGKTQTLSTMGGENNGVVCNDLRIRKLTPKECLRLMGVKNEDIDKMSKNQSDSSLYHLAGDSIVVNVLMAIFKEMIK